MNSKTIFTLIISLNPLLLLLLKAGFSEYTWFSFYCFLWGILSFIVIIFYSNENITTSHPSDNLFDPINFFLIFFILLNPFLAWGIIDFVFPDGEFFDIFKRRSYEAKDFFKINILPWLGCLFFVVPMAINTSLQKRNITFPKALEKIIAFLLGISVIFFLSTCRGG